MNMDLALFSFWSKTDRLRASDSEAVHDASLDFHPLIYHLLDVAACAKALLRRERSRVEWLAKSCNVDAEALSRCFVALIALHDIGKCARGFQGKVLQLWPEYLGPKPAKELSVRHDAAGVWLFDQNDGLAQIAREMLPNLCESCRLMMILSGVRPSWRAHRYGLSRPRHPQENDRSEGRGSCCNDRGRGRCASAATGLFSSRRACPARVILARRASGSSGLAWLEPDLVRFSEASRKRRPIDEYEELLGEFCATRCKTCFGTSRARFHLYFTAYRSPSPFRYGRQKIYGDAAAKICGDRRAARGPIAVHH